MEFSFKIPAWMNIFLERPIFIVIWAAFGIFFFTLIFLMISNRINRIFESKFLENVINILGISLIITWLAGFILMIFMFFIDVHPIKLIIIWLLLFTTILIFCIVKYRLILKWVDSEPEIPLIKKNTTEK